jgi:hypothetical protein
MGGMFSGPKLPPPPPPPPPPGKSDEEVRSAELEDRRRRAAAKGRQSTILTGAQGVEDQGAGGKKMLGS